MSVNVYGTAATLRMSRSLINRKYSHKTSEPFGYLTPIGMPQEVLPGDMWSLKLSNVKRMIQPKTAIMDDISADIYGFFVPLRLIDSKAKQLFGENDQVAWTLPEDVELPHIILDGTSLSEVYTDDAQAFANGGYLYLCEEDSNGNITRVIDSIFKDTLFEFFGLPFVWPSPSQVTDMETKFNTSNFVFKWSVLALPFRAYQMVYNEFFRNENVTDPRLDFNYDGNDMTIDLSVLSDVKDKFRLNRVARWKDLFTSLLPAPQRGPSVGFGITGYAPVVPLEADAPGGVAMHGNGLMFRFDSENGLADTSYLGVDGSTKRVFANWSNPGEYPGRGSITKSNLFADLNAATAVTVNQLRLAFATQRYYEKLARGGARYNEYLQVFFGVRPSDAVLQRPQYLGGKHVHINVSQVIATANSEDPSGNAQPVGQVGAYSATGFTDHIFSNAMTEHGVLLCFVANRKEHTYCQGMDKYWTKRDVFDIYNPTFAHIGEVPCATNEVYWQIGNTDVLGYNEAWYEYRSQSSKCTGLLNPLRVDALGYYVLTDVFDSQPTLTDDFILEDPNGLDRALYASASVTHQFISDYYFEYKLARVMPVRSTPGLIDHY